MIQIGKQGTKLFECRFYIRAFSEFPNGEDGVVVW
jgi:hypothetical protein